MELLKETTPLEFKHGDVTFLVKAEATALDRLALVSMGELRGDKSMVVKKSDFTELLMERFVVGWRGVTQDGVEVPYSLEALRRLPQGNGEVPLLLLLSDFIVKNTHIVPLQSNLKNGSREQSSGPAK